MGFDAKRVFLIFATATFLALGLVYPVLNATTVTRTVTTMVVSPGTTVVTVITAQGSTVSLYVESPRVRMIMSIEVQDQVCVVRFASREQPTVISFAGTTLTFPGTTATFVVSQPFSTAITSALPTRVTTSGFLQLETVTTMTAGFVTVVFTYPLSIYGVFEEACNVAYEIVRQRFEPERLPATFVLAMAGQTLEIPGFTMTFSPGEVPTVRLTTTFTTTKKGETEVITTTIPATTISVVTVVPGTTRTTTVVRPGTTITTVTVITTVLTEATPQPTPTPTPTPRPTPTLTPTPTPTPTRTEAQPLDVSMLLPIIAVVIAVVAVGALLALRRRR